MENFGICFLSIVPVRAEPSDKAEITTQLIFGDLCEKLENTQDNKWLKVKLENDEYEGWIDVKQISFLSKERYEYLKKAKKYKTIESVTKVKSDGGDFLVPAGSTFYKVEQEWDLYGGLNVHGELKKVEEKTPSEIINLAKSYLNAPYLWGGKTHFGIDCSGFVQQVFGIAGFNLPRDAWQQEKMGLSVDIHDIKPTDVAFFKNPSGKIVHVGIILSKDQIIHASGKVRIDKFDEKGIFKNEIHDYSHLLASIRRIVN